MTPDDVRATTASTYDRIVDDFVQRNSSVPSDVAEFRASFIDAVRRHGLVADLGCGPGRDAAHFRAEGLEVVGVDTSEQMARRARGADVAVVQADIRRLPLRPERLDGIWSAASLLHVPRADVPRTLRGWWSCLHTDAVLALATSLGDTEGWEDCPYDPDSQPTSEPLRRWFVHHDREALLGLLDAAGFDVVTARERTSHRRWLQVLARRRDG
jgi:SAM-dependent methyltransferase